MSGGGICDLSFKLIALNENKGQGYARNLAIKQATGDYIMFLDPDDWYELDAFEKAYNQITKNNNDIVIFSHYNYSEKNATKVESKDRTIPFNEVIDSPHINLKEINGHIFSANYAWAQIYKRDFLLNNSVEFGDGCIGEDSPFMAKALVSADSISILNEPLYNYRKFTMDDNQRKSTLEKRAKTYDKNILNKKLGLNIVIDSKCSNFIDSFSINQINSTYNIFNEYVHYMRDSNEKEQIFEKCFVDVKRLFSLIHQNANIKKIKHYINYDFYKCILASKDYSQYKRNLLIQRILLSIFSIRCIEYNLSKRIKVSILGIKFAMLIKKTI